MNKFVKDECADGLPPAPTRLISLFADLLRFQARALCPGHRVDHLMWFEAECKVLACLLSFYIFRLEIQVCILLARSSVRSPCSVLPARL